MSDLTFKLIYKPHSPGHDMPWIEHDSGVLRKATPEEVALWDAVADLRARLAEAEAKKRR